MNLITPERLPSLWIGNAVLPSVKVAEVDGWTLVESIIKPSVNLLNAGSCTIIYTPDLQLNEQVFIDDIKISPLKSSVKCFVYDPQTHRVISEFSDQHFQTIYQYNGKGQLVRKIAETADGMRTLAETQYNTPKLFQR